MTDPHARVNARLRENGTLPIVRTISDGTALLLGKSIHQGGQFEGGSLDLAKAIVNPPRAKSRRGAKK